MSVYCLVPQLFSTVFIKENIRYTTGLGKMVINNSTVFMLFEEKFNTTVSYNIACVVYMKRKPGGKHAVIKKKINHKASYISFKAFKITFPSLVAK